MHNKITSQQKSRKYSAPYQLDKTTTFASQNYDNQSICQVRNLRKGSADVVFSETNYKTEVCKYWENNQFCPYGLTCKFAHGELQMRSKDGMSVKYKTKLCKNFHQNSYCPYGQRCQFIHNKFQKTKNLKFKLIRRWLGEDQLISSMFQKNDHNSSRLKCIKPKKTSNQQPQILNPQPQDQSQSFKNQYLHQISDTLQEFSLPYQKPRLYSL